MRAVFYVALLPRGDGQIGRPGATPAEAERSARREMTRIGWEDELHIERIEVVSDTRAGLRIALSGRYPTGIADADRIDRLLRRLEIRRVDAEPAPRPHDDPDDPTQF